MNQTDYTDYHQLRWDVPKKPLTKLQFIAHRLFYILPYCVLAAFIANKLVNQQTIIIRQELYWVYLAIASMILCVIIVLDFILSKSLGQKIDVYQLNKAGLWINQKHIAIQKLSPTKIDLMIKSPSRYVKQNLESFELKFPHSKNFLTLRFTDQASVGKFFTSLHHYLKL